MKEFIDKLIGRLEEYIETAKAEGDFTYIKPFEIAKNAVNQLAEEYKGNLSENLISSETVITNADKIRAMSDEELAEYIFGVSIGNAPCVLCSEECDFCELSDEQCKEKTLNWLQSEAE